MRPTRSPLALLALAALAAGCTDAVDKAARDRIFSPEEPAPEVQRAQEKIAVADASTNPAVWARLWNMDRLEATRRLGGHRATSTITWKWTRGARTVTLVEEAKFETDARGDFHTTLTNDEDSGLEFIWAEGRAYARGKYGPFRARRIDRAQQDRWRDEGTGALTALFTLFDRRLRASPLGSGRYQDRPGQRFALVLGEPWGPAPTPIDAPPIVYGQVRRADKLVTGPDDDTARRLDFEQHRQPDKVSGEIVVDEASAVILKAKARAHFVVPGAGKDPGASLDLEIAFDTVPDDKVSVKAPSNVTAPRLPHAVNDPLSFLGQGGSNAAPDKSVEKEREDDEDAPADPAAEPTAPAQDAPKPR